MLGNAPTRIVVCAEVDVARNVRNKTSAIRRRLLTLSSDDHGQNTGILLLCSRLPLVERGDVPEIRSANVVLSRIFAAASRTSRKT